MKNLFVLLVFTLFASVVGAQQIDQWGMIPYSKYAPSSSNKPTVHESHFWFNTSTGNFSRYNRTSKTWGNVVAEGDTRFGEMSISNDTFNLTFAATTAAPIEDLTAGLLNGFTLVGDSCLRYDGTTTAKFSITYSLSVSFAEAANLITAYPVIGTTPILRTRSRQTVTLTTDKVQLNSSGLITLQPGQTIRLLAVPITHTGSDILAVYECNVNVREIK